VENYAAGRKLTGIGLVAGPEPTDSLDAGAFAWAEIAAALHVGDGTADQLIHTARRLTTHLPATLAALGRGDLTLVKATRTAQRTANLTETQCAEVEARVLTRAVTRSPAQHDQALRRTVDRVDPDGLATRRAQAADDITLIRTHHGDGMGELFSRMPSEDLETVWLAADTHARRAKAAGDPHTLDQLRVAALVAWADAYLTTGHPTHPDTDTDDIPGPVDPDTGEIADPPTPPAATPTRAPRRHGRAVTVNITIDLPTFLGLTDHPGEILGTGALLPADTIRDLLPDATLRRILTDPTTGHLLDLGTTTRIPTAALAEHCTMRDVTATTPTSTAPAAAGDLDHITRPEDGGPTNPDNLHTPTRRWHRAKTLARWTITPHPDRTRTWTSPTGRTYRTEPHDYRLGP
jgi:hypothetical protein